MALDPYADSEANFLAWIAGQGAPAATDPLALGPTPTPTTEEVPAGMLPPEPAPAAPSDQWWPSSWLAGGDEAAKAMNAPQAPAPEQAAPPAPGPNPLAASPAELDRLPPPLDLANEPTHATRVEDLGQAMHEQPNARQAEIDYANEPLLNPNEAVGQAQLNVMAARNPEAYAGYIAKHQAEQADLVAAEKSRRALELRQQADRELESYQKASAAAQAKTEQLVAEAQQIASTKIDRGRAWSRRTTAGKIAGVLQAVIGGLMAKGGPNQGLQQLFKEIDDDVEDQKADLQRQAGQVHQQQTLVAQAFGRTGDLYQAGVTARLAALKGLEDELASYSTSLDPKGHRMVVVQDAVNKVREARIAAAQKANAEMRKQLLEVAKHDLDVVKQQEAARHARAEEGIAWTNASTSAKRLAFDEKKADRDFKLDVRKEDRQDRELKQRQDELKQKRDEALAKEDRELGIGGVTKTEWVDGQVADPVTGALRPGKVPKYTTHQLKNADGSTFKAKTEKEAQELRLQRTGTQELYDLLGDFKRLRERVGGTNKWSSPNDDAEMRQLESAVAIAYGKSRGLSLADENSVQLNIKAVFGGDPSSYRADDVVSRVENALSAATSRYHNALKTNEYTGALPTFDRGAPSVAGTTRNTQEEATKKILQDRESADEKRLTEGQNEGLTELRNQARSGNNDARQALVDLASARRSVSGPVAKYLQTEFPDLLEAAAARVKDTDPEQYVYLQYLLNQNQIQKGGQ